MLDITAPKGDIIHETAFGGVSVRFFGGDIKDVTPESKTAADAMIAAAAWNAVMIERGTPNHAGGIDP